MPDYYSCEKYILFQNMKMIGSCRLCPTIVVVKARVYVMWLFPRHSAYNSIITYLIALCADSCKHCVTRELTHDSTRLYLQTSKVDTVEIREYLTLF